MFLSLFSTTYFVGAALGALFIPPLSDVYGRRKIFLVSLIISSLNFGVQLVLPYPDEWALYILAVTFLVNGLMSAGRKSLGYCFFVELSPKRFSDTLGTIWNVSEYAIINILLNVYFQNISKNWITTIWIGLGYAVISILGVYFIVPESPKWLYAKERWEDLSIVLKYMARINGVIIPEDSNINELIHAENDVAVIEYNEIEDA